MKEAAQVQGGRGSKGHRVAGRETQPRAKATGKVLKADTKWLIIWQVRLGSKHTHNTAHTHTHRDKKKRYSKGFCFNKKLFNLISTVCILVKLSSGGIATKRLSKKDCFYLGCLAWVSVPHPHTVTHTQARQKVRVVRRDPSGPSGSSLSHRSPL